MRLQELTRSQYREWLAAAERDGEIEDGGVRTDPAAEPADQPKIGDLLDHIPTQRVYEIVGFRAGNSTLQVCPIGKRLVSVAVYQRREPDPAPGTQFGADSRRLCVLLGGDAIQ